jgi:hypothetical protein
MYTNQPPALIKLTQEPPIATIQLHRPDVINTLNLQALVLPRTFKFCG